MDVHIALRREDVTANLAIRPARQQHDIACERADGRPRRGVARGLVVVAPHLRAGRDRSATVVDQATLLLLLEVAFRRRFASGLDHQILVGGNRGADIGDHIAAGDGDVASLDGHCVPANRAALSNGFIEAVAGGAGRGVEQAAMPVLSTLAPVVTVFGHPDVEVAARHRDQGTLGAVDRRCLQLHVPTCLQLDIADSPDIGTNATVVPAAQIIVGIAHVVLLPRLPYGAQ